MIIWDPETGKQLGKTLIGHKQWITYLSWQPLHLNEECRYLASSSKDTTIKIWDTVMFTCVRNLTGHTQSVTCIRWGGKNLIYSSSQDRTIKVWRSEDVSNNFIYFQNFSGWTTVFKITSILFL